MSIQEYPVIIAGAGPAGCVTSLFLSDFKIPHLIVEKGVFPRDKICGDAVSGKMLDIIAKLHPEKVKAFAEDKSKSTLSYGMQFVAPGGNSVGIPFPKPKGDLPIGFVSKRMEFDNFLYGLTESSFATRMEGTEITEVENTDRGVKITLKKGDETFQVFSPMVIGSDGSRSMIKKKLLGDEVDEMHYCAGIRAYYKGVTGLHPDNFIELHFYKELLPGYFWIFPLPDGYTNVGMGMLSADVSRKKVNLRKEMLNLIETNPRLKERFKYAELDGKIAGWGLPLGSKKRPLSGDHFILTGDAASLIDPFTGEGIGNAGVSGMVAARIARQAVEQKNYSASFLKQYDDIMYQRLWNELKLSHRIQRLSSRPWLFNFVVNKITNNKQLREIFTNMFIDLDLRAKLKSPMFYFRLLFNR